MNYVVDIKDLHNTFPKSNFLWLKDDAITSVINLLPQGTWRFVGGVVRDSLLGIQTYDIDITTTDAPDQIESYFKNYFTISLVGKRFGTIGIFAHPYKIEITTTRNDQNCDGRWADVVYSKSFYEDSLRRDFTINALLCDGQQIIDYHGGLSDLAHQKIKFVGSAERRITEDYLRIMRYIRFSARFAKKSNYLDYIDTIPQYLDGIQQLSYERIGSELYNMMKHPSFLDAIDLCNVYGVSKVVFGYKFPSIPKQFISPEEKTAYVLKNFSQSNKLGLPKIIQQIIYLLKSYKNASERLWTIWKKYKRIDFLQLFCKLHKIAHKPFPKKLKFVIDYSNIPQHERGQLTKKLHMKYFDQLLCVDKVTEV